MGQGRIRLGSMTLLCILFQAFHGTAIPDLQSDRRTVLGGNGHGNNAARKGMGSRRLTLKQIYYMIVGVSFRILSIC